MCKTYKMHSQFHMSCLFEGWSSKWTAKGWLVRQGCFHGSKKVGSTLLFFREICLERDVRLKRYPGSSLVYSRVHGRIKISLAEFFFFFLGYCFKKLCVHNNFCVTIFKWSIVIGGKKVVDSYENDCLSFTVDHFIKL